MTNTQFQAPYVKFKGIKIPALTYSRRSIILSLVDPSRFKFMDLAVALFGCICEREDLIDALEDRKGYNRKVSDWIDEIQFGPKDAEEAARIFKRLIEDSKEGEVEPDDMQGDPDLISDEELPGNG